RLEPRRGVVHVPTYAAAPGRPLVREYLAGVDRDAYPRPKAGIGELHLEFRGRFHHLKNRSHRPESIVFVRDRNAESADDRVADELLDRSPVALDRRRHHLEIAVKEPAEQLSVK